MGEFVVYYIGGRHRPRETYTGARKAVEMASRHVAANMRQQERLARDLERGGEVSFGSNDIGVSIYSAEKDPG